MWRPLPGRRQPISAASRAVNPEAIHKRIQAALGGALPGKIGVAVSGGSDSLALLHLMAGWAGPEIAAVTVDHGLRPASAREAEFVAKVCASLNIRHTTLVWEAWDGQGNLQDRARRARYGLIADWAGAEAIAHVALGHTIDDQAETFLMRLARSAGIDGLSAMPAARDWGGIVWLRPLLETSRSALRDYLKRRNVVWIDDPSNEDEGSERVRARHALASLAPLGLGAEQIARSARNLAEARGALAAQTVQAADAIAATDAGDVILDLGGLSHQPAEIRRRLVGGALAWVGSAEYGPRGAALHGFVDRLMAGEDATLHGCLALVGDGKARICREYEAVRNLQSAAHETWDSRWVFRGGPAGEGVIRALGPDGLRDCPDWRETGRPRAALLASAALWQGQNLVSAPAAGLAGGWRLEIARECPDFKTFLLSR